MSERKGGKGWWIAIVAVAVALVGGVVFVVGDWFVQSNKEAVEFKILRDRHSDDPLKYEKLGPPSFYRLTFHATVDGEPVEIVRVGECRPFLASGGMGAGYTLRHTLIPSFAGQRLSDGSAYYVRMPNYCFRLRGAGKFERWRDAGTEDVLPQGFWVDNINAPSLVESYVTARYFEQPEARVKGVEGQVEFLESRPEVMPQGGPADAVLGTPGPTGVTLGYSPEAFIDDGWKMIPVNPELRSALPASPVAISARGRFKVFDTSGVLDGGRRFKMSGNPNGPTRELYNGEARARHIHKLMAGLPLNFPKNLLTTSSDTELVQIAGDLFSEMMPLRRDGDARYDVRLRPRGYTIWQPGTGPGDQLSQGGKVVSFVIEGDPVEVDLTTLHIYKLAILDTQDGQIYVPSL